MTRPKIPDRRRAAVLVVAAAALATAGCGGGAFDPRVDEADQRRAAEQTRAPTAPVDFDRDPAAAEDLPVGTDVEATQPPSSAFPVPARP